MHVADSLSVPLGKKLIPLPYCPEVSLARISFPAYIGSKAHMWALSARKARVRVHCCIMLGRTCSCSLCAEQEMALEGDAHSDPRLNSSKLLAISGEQTIFLAAHGVIKCNANDIEKKRGREWLQKIKEAPMNQKKAEVSSA